MKGDYVIYRDGYDVVLFAGKYAECVNWIKAHFMCHDPIAEEYGIVSVSSGRYVSHVIEW